MKYQFKPGLFTSVTTLILLPIFISLGFWQLSRAQEKRDIQEKIQQRSNQKPISLQQLFSKEKIVNKQQQYLPIRFQGKFDNQQQFLLDNKIYKHQVGYEVITPVKVKGLNKLVLVNRGWITAGHNRKLLPTLTMINDEQSIIGKIYIPLGKLLALAKDNVVRQPWPKRIQQLNFQQIQSILKQPIYHFVVLLDPKAAHGFIRQWQFSHMKPAKHVAYATQWFAFATLLLILYVVLNIQRREKSN